MKMQWSVVVMLLSGLVAAGCSKEEEKKAPTTSACDTMTFATDIAPIVGDNGTGACAKCHTDSGINEKFDTLASFQNNKSVALERVSSDDSALVMPQPHTNGGGIDFKTTDDGKKLITWLGCSTLK